MVGKAMILRDVPHRGRSMGWTSADAVIDIIL